MLSKLRFDRHAIKILAFLDVVRVVLLVYTISHNIHTLQYKHNYRGVTRSLPRPQMVQKAARRASILTGFGKQTDLEFPSCMLLACRTRV